MAPATLRQWIAASRACRLAVGRLGDLGATGAGRLLFSWKRCDDVGGRRRVIPRSRCSGAASGSWSGLMPRCRELTTQCAEAQEGSWLPHFSHIP